MLVARRKILVLGGVPNSLLNFRGPLLSALVREGHEVIACSAPAPPDVIESLRSLGVGFRAILVNRAGLNPFPDLRLCFAIARLLRVENPDLILAYTAKPVIFGGIAARLTKAGKFYAMVEGLGYAFGSDSFKQKLLGRFVGFLYRLALGPHSSIFFLNPDDERFFRDKKIIGAGSKSIQINGIGIDLNRYQITRIPKKPVFSLLARLLADKGLREFHAAAMSLKRKYPQARFLLAGSLDANPTSIGREELQCWIDEGVIEYRGLLKDVRPFLSETQVYVLPSYYREGLPRSILEAMAMGRPIITTDAPGCRETVIDGENGFLVPPRDSLALEQAMERFILDPTLAPRMGAASLEIARAKYDVNKVNAVIMKAMGLDSSPK